MPDTLINFIEKLTKKRILKIAAALISVIIAFAIPIFALPIGAVLGYVLKPKIDEFLKKLPKNSKDKQIAELKAKVDELSKKLEEKQ